MSREHIEIPITGMTCSSCARRVEQKLNKVEGVEAWVNYATEKASIDFDALTTHPQQLVKVIKDTGYGAVLAEDPEQENHENHQTNKLRKRLLLSALLAFPVALLSMVPYLQFDRWQWLALGLATPVAIWGAWPFHQNAWKNAMHKTATMDTLVSIGVLSAWLWSLYALFFGGAGMTGMKMGFDFWPSNDSSSMHLYFEVAAVLVVFVLAGRYLENRARKNAGAALKALLGLSAKEVSILDADGTETKTSVENLQIGDRFVIRPGEKIATDATIEKGTTAVDESMITGESNPIEKQPGEAIIGGTINLSGHLVAVASRVGQDTVLAQIVKLVSQAQTGKAPVQRLADKVSNVFVPVVILLSLFTLVFWIIYGQSTEFAFSAAVSVLVIACPCALGLATPTALMVGTSLGAQKGLLIKGPEILQSTKEIDTILLDKTGTVTTGEMTLIDVWPSKGESKEQILKFAGALENLSEHPVAKAITSAAQKDSETFLSVQDFENHEGYGVQAIIEGSRVQIGKSTFLKQQGIVLPDAFQKQQALAQQKGQTVVGIAWDGHFKGMLAVADCPKQSSAQAIKQIKAMGIKTILLTGDNHHTAWEIAKQVGIEDVIADVPPEGKANVVASLQQKGHVVAMVGDGINDAPALMGADLGIAIGSGTDVAIEASDITLVKGDLLSVVEAIQLSRSTLKIIKQNLFWAFGYNVAAIPLAALGLLNPLLAGAAMAFSSVSVVLNALRLKRF